MPVGFPVESVCGVGRRGVSCVCNTAQRRRPPAQPCRSLRRYSHSPFSLSNSCPSPQREEQSPPPALDDCGGRREGGRSVAFGRRVGVGRLEVESRCQGRKRAGSYAERSSSGGDSARSRSYIYSRQCLGWTRGCFMWTTLRKETWCGGSSSPAVLPNPLRPSMAGAHG